MGIYYLIRFSLSKVGVTDLGIPQVIDDVKFGKKSVDHD
jgi:hypothetical protein